MASFGRSFKAPPYLSTITARRPNMPGRSISSGSARDLSPDSRPASPRLSPGDLRQDDIVFSPRSSPTTLAMDNRQYPSPGSSGGLFPPASGHGDSTQLSNPTDFSLFDSLRSTPSKTRPIAIELPTTKKSVNGASVYTPPAPLSARGEIPGGYFPLHEEQNRTYHPHPFQLDATKARKRSIQLAHKESKSPDALPTLSKVTATGIVTPPGPVTAPATMAPDSSSNFLKPSSNSHRTSSSSPNVSTTPVASYNPGPYGDNPLPMGKYYPSNYERRKAEKHGRPIPSTSATSAMPPPPVPVSTSTTMSKDALLKGHTRNESDAKRRLQQYQRDMIAQATLALNDRSLNPSTMQSLRSIGFTSVMGANPSKPRLEPLGSPGPVTPMELGGSDNYLAARGTADDLQAEEIARILRIEEERKRREGGSSPIIDLMPSSF